MNDNALKYIDDKINEYSSNARLWGERMDEYLKKYRESKNEIDSAKFMEQAVESKLKEYSIREFISVLRKIKSL